MKEGMSKVGTIGTAAILLLALSTHQAYATGKQLETESAGKTTITGTYTVLLYGCRYADDIENAVILVSEGSRYPVEIYAPETRYKVKKGLDAKKALAEAKAFVKCGVHTVWQTQTRRIRDDAGGTIGYELRPLYYPYDVGAADVLLISYSLKGNKVTAYIRLTLEMENRLNRERRPGRRR
jgi:hypothetical protein